MVVEDQQAQFIVRCSIELRTQLEQIAHERGHSLSELVRRMLKDSVDQYFAGETASGQLTRSDVQKMIAEELDKRLGTKQ